MVENFEGIDYVIVDNETLLEFIDSLQSPNLPDNLITTKVTDMSYLFQDKIINSNTDILRKWDVSNVENFEGMFLGSRPYTVKPNNKLFIDNWDTSSAKNMTDMFRDTSLGYIDIESGFEIIGIGSWDVSNVISMPGMFTNSNFNGPIGDWDVSNFIIWMVSTEYTFNQPCGCKCWAHKAMFM